MEPMPASSNPISSSGRKSPLPPLHMLAKLVVGLDGGGVLTFVKQEIKTKEEATSASDSGRTHLFAQRTQTSHDLPTSWQPHIFIKD